MDVIDYIVFLIIYWVIAGFITYIFHKSTAKGIIRVKDKYGTSKYTKRMQVIQGADCKKIRLYRRLQLVGIYVKSSKYMIIPGWLILNWIDNEVTVNGKIVEDHVEIIDKEIEMYDQYENEHILKIG